MVPQDLQQEHNTGLSQHLFIDQCSPGKELFQGGIPQPLNSRPIEIHLITTVAHILSQQCICNSHYSLFHLRAPRVIAEVALCAMPVSPAML